MSTAVAAHTWRLYHARTARDAVSGVAGASGWGVMSMPSFYGTRLARPA